MNILVEAVQFNHDWNCYRSSALNIRRNGSEMLPDVEWRRGICRAPEDSLAAYSLADIDVDFITVKAQFRRMVSNVEAVEVRAIDPSCRVPRRIVSLLRRKGASLPQQNVLGEVARRVIRFGPDGLTKLESFRLKNTRIHELGVGAWSNTWQWQYRLSPKLPWVNIDETEHRIFVVASIPKEPWGQLPFEASNVLLPWSDLLEYVCRWAQGSKTLNAAATGVTHGLYNLGPSVIEYNCPGGGGPCYAMVDLTAFLDRLRGGVGLGRYVNCEDCAHLVTTLSNLLGCELWATSIYSREHGIELNPIVPIGGMTWGMPCGWTHFAPAGAVKSKCV